MTALHVSCAPHRRPSRRMLPLAAVVAAALTLGLSGAPRAGTSDAERPPEQAVEQAVEQAGPLAIFTATHAQFGIEAWTTDGTRFGTTLLRRIGDSTAGGSFAGHFADLGDGRAIFSARPRNYGFLVPFVTDGTRGGTQLIRLFESSEYAPTGYTPLGDGRIVFITRNAQSHASLWVTDTTRAGTFQIAQWGRNDFPVALTSLGDGRALFSAILPDTGEELWITDGTVAGTRLVRDIVPGTGHGAPRGFAALGDGRAVFSAAGGELWVTDGTHAGTQRVVPESAAIQPRRPQELTPVGGGRAIFAAESPGRELWITDGTHAGTAPLRSRSDAVVTSPTEFGALGDGRFLFSAVSSAHGRELWITDGTAAGTELLRDINPGGWSEPQRITPLGDRRAVFWVLNDPDTAGVALWVSDGTPSGTQRVRHLPDIASGMRARLATLGAGRALFVGYGAARGWEPWVTDGTPRGTHLLRNIHRTHQSDPREFTAFLPATGTDGTGAAAIAPPRTE